jgi:hypothetical protein
LGSNDIRAVFVAHPKKDDDKLDTTHDLFSVDYWDKDVSELYVGHNALRENGIRYQISLGSHVRHGLVSRRAVQRRVEVFAKIQSFDQAITWFEECFFHD